LAALYYRKDNYQLALKYVDSSLLEKYRSLDTYDKNTWYQYFWRSIYLVRLGQPQKALALLDSLPGTSYNNRRLIYQALYKEAAAAKDWKMAFTWHKEYIRNLDSILVTAKVTKVSGLLFEAEQKHTAAEKQIRITALENKNLIKERQQSKFISAAIGTGLLLLLAIAILMGMYRYTQVKRHSEKQLLTAELYRMESVIHDERQLQLEALSSQRKKIAENMHDEVSSGLAAFRFYIVDLKARAENKETTAILTELEAEAQVLYQQARDFMKNLNANIPSARYNVCELADQLSVRFANEKLLVIKNNIDRNGVEQYFTGSVHYELYLVIKEAVANSIKHAGASLVEIGIWFKDHTCFFSIGDNGKGFNTETAGTDGLGLKSIANRIQTINGDLKIRSAGSGTLIEGFFPV
jgi:signal transduction histidine kinase